MPDMDRDLIGRQDLSDCYCRVSLVAGDGETAQVRATEHAKPRQHHHLFSSSNLKNANK